MHVVCPQKRYFFVDGSDEGVPDETPSGWRDTRGARDGLANWVGQPRLV